MRSIVAFATNARRQVAMFCQRSDARRVVLWDYHVVLVTPAKPGFRASSEEPSPSQGGWVVWDPEFAPPPVAGSHAPDSFDLQFYLRAAFSVSPDGRGSQDAPGHDIPSGYRPQFRLIPAELYVRDFGSDRHHMRDDQGRPTVPFPEWPLIRPERYECLEEILDLKSKKWGRWVTLEELWNTPAPY